MQFSKPAIQSNILFDFRMMGRHGRHYESKKQRSTASASSAEYSPGEDEAKAAEQWDPVSKLTCFCQKICKRPLCKADIVHTLQRFKAKEDKGYDYQASVKLNCFTGAPVFAGALSSDPKEARKNAASQALQAYPEAVAELPAQSSRAQKRKAAAKAHLADLKFKTEELTGNRFTETKNLEKEAATVAEAPVSKAKACAKMLLRSGLRCRCHYAYLHDCPTNKSTGE